MGKKFKNKTDAESATAATASARKINALLIVGALVIMTGIIWYSLRPAAPVQTVDLPKPGASTLDPAQFSGVVRTAYEAAKEVPEVLAQIPCYCGCMSNFGHKSNLDCFHDTHGVECTMCQDIAIDARKMYRNGYSIDRIRQTVKDRYGRYAANMD